MYAVIETGGKQYKVGVGDKLKVERLAADEGASVELDRVLMISDGEKVEVGSPTLASAVTATVVSHGKSGKIKVFKMKRRKNYRRTQGHRQDYTEIQITGINGEKAPATKTADKKKAESENKDASSEKGAAKKATKKKAAKKKTTKKKATATEAKASKADNKATKKKTTKKKAAKKKSEAKKSGE